MTTNGMTINGLNPLSALTADDKIPVWDTGASDEPTKEITAQNMANSVKSLASLPNNTEMNTAIEQSTADVIRTGDVINNLTSTNTDKPLSANMGKALNDKIALQQIVPIFGANVKGICLCTIDGNGNVAIFVDFLTTDNLSNRQAVVYVPEIFRPSANQSVKCAQASSVAEKAILYGYVNEGADVTTDGAVRQRITASLGSGLHVTFIFQYSV